MTHTPNSRWYDGPPIESAHGTDPVNTDELDVLHGLRADLPGLDDEADTRIRQKLHERGVPVGPESAPVPEPSKDMVLEALIDRLRPRVAGENDVDESQTLHVQGTEESEPEAVDPKTVDQVSRQLISRLSKKLRTQR